MTKRTVLMTVRVMTFQLRRIDLIKSSGNTPDSFVVVVSDIEVVVVIGVVSERFSVVVESDDEFISEYILKTNFLSLSLN